MRFLPEQIIPSVQPGWMGVVLIHSIVSQGHHATKNKAIRWLLRKIIESKPVYYTLDS